MRRLILPLTLLLACDGGLDDVTATATATAGDAATLSSIEAEIFAKSCAFAACHKGASPAGGLNLEGDTYAALVGVAATGTSKTLVVAGDPDASYLLEKLTAMEPAAGDPMPPTEPLSDARIATIRGWIEDGAPDN